MKKSELIEKLKEYIKGGNVRSKIQSVFAPFFIEYLEKLDISSQEKYDFWHIDPYLPQIVTDAFEELRTGADDYVLHYRKMYKDKTGYDVPNITDVGKGILVQQALVQQALAVRTTGSLLDDATGSNFLESQISSYCMAQNNVIQQLFDRFLRLVYRKGLFEIIEKSREKGMNGKFGQTELRSYEMAGRLIFTFARKKDNSEISVSFITEGGDPLGYSAGLQSLYASFEECLSMIKEVIQCWPDIMAKRKRIFKNNKEVMLDAVATMKSAK